MIMKRLILFNLVLALPVLADPSGGATLPQKEYFAKAAGDQLPNEQGIALVLEASFGISAGLVGAFGGHDIPDELRKFAAAEADHAKAVKAMTPYREAGKTIPVAEARAVVAAEDELARTRA